MVKRRLTIKGARRPGLTFTTGKRFTAAPNNSLLRQRYLILLARRPAGALVDLAEIRFWHE